MTKCKPIAAPSRVEAYVAAALCVLWWLAGAIMRGGFAGRSARLNRLLSRAESAVEYIVFLKAAAVRAPVMVRARTPRVAPPGFRRVENRRLRLFFRNAGIRARRGNAFVRIAALIEALTRPECAVAYFTKRIINGLRVARLVLAASIAERVGGLFAGPAPAQTNTS